MLRPKGPLLAYKEHQRSSVLYLHSILHQPTLSEQKVFAIIVLTDIYPITIFR